MAFEAITNFFRSEKNQTGLAILGGSAAGIGLGFPIGIALIGVLNFVCAIFLAAFITITLMLVLSSILWAVFVKGLRGSENPDTLENGRVIMPPGVNFSASFAARMAENYKPLSKDRSVTNNDEDAPTNADIPPGARSHSS